MRFLYRFLKPYGRGCGFLSGFPPFSFLLSDRHVSSSLPAEIMAPLPPLSAFVVKAHLPRKILEPSNDDFFGPHPKSFNASLSWP